MGRSNMGSMWQVRAVTVVVASLVLAASCGGDDDDASSATTAASDGTAAVTVAADEASTSAESVTSATSASTQATPATTAASGGDAAAGDALAIGDVDARCRAIFSDGEVDAVLQEPWTLDASANESLGQTVCSWATIDESPDAVDGWALLIVQVYSGDPIPARNFVDPSIYPEVTMLDGFGEIAYTVGPKNTNYAFFDDPVAGFLDYSEVNTVDLEAPPRNTSDDVLELFRTLHDRLT